MIVSQSLNKTIKEHQGIVYHCAQKYSFLPIYDDLISVGFEALWGAIETWEPCLTLDLKDYLFFKVRFAMVDLVRQKTNNQISSELNDSLSAKNYDYDMFVISEEIKQVISDLPESEQYVIRKIFYEKQSNSSIARELKISRERVGQIRDRAFRRLRSMIKFVLITDVVA